MDRLDALEQRVADLERRLALKQDDYRILPAIPHEFGPGFMPKCGCRVGSVCNSTACPHLMQPGWSTAPGAFNEVSARFDADMVRRFDTAEIDGVQ
jgi:hypothetical protein